MPKELSRKSCHCCEYWKPVRSKKTPSITRDTCKWGMMIMNPILYAESCAKFITMEDFDKIMRD